LRVGCGPIRAYDCRARCSLPAMDANEDTSQVLRRVIEAFNRRDQSAARELLDPEVVWVPTPAFFELETRGRNATLVWFGEAFDADWDETSSTSPSTATGASARSRSVSSWARRSAVSSNSALSGRGQPVSATEGWREWKSTSTGPPWLIGSTHRRQMRRGRDERSERM
jgi:hypothetical protein